MYDIVNPLAQKSILCVKSSMITRKNEVQKKIKLENIINSCKYFPAGSVGEGYVPLTLGITIRDKTTNRVLVKRVEKDNIKRTFIYLNDITPVPHVGYDLIMFLSSVGVTGLIKNKDNMMVAFSSVMSESVFDVNGLLWMERNTEPNCILLDPMVMTTIYVNADNFSKYIVDDWKFERISEVKEESGFIKCIIDDLVEIKEDNNE